ncbi:Dscam [Cordylochernes scorpioides]|uniref:Dscam n=1 Tax=Cordylochernes scorpioides TaxID=51811 RepID=A0ABY6JZK7_9ARAC|nr:Dscam [Cordylochernes scorpioides]
MIFILVLAICVLQVLCDGFNDEPPQIQPFSFPNNLKIGAKTTIVCATINGKPPFTFRWLKDEANVDSKSFPNIRIVKGEVFSNLLIDPIDSNSSGNYTCEVKNKNGLASLSSYLNIQAPPSWLSAPQDATALEGGHVSLQCKAKGSPAPHITWIRIEENHKQAVNSSVLIFNSVERVHAGKYRCTADNGLGPPLQHTVTLTVHCE